MKEQKEIFNFNVGEDSPELDKLRRVLEEGGFEKDPGSFDPKRGTIKYRNKQGAELEMGSDRNQRSISGSRDVLRRVVFQMDLTLNDVFSRTVKLSKERVFRLGPIEARI